MSAAVTSIQYIRDDKEIAAWCRRAREDGRIGIDVEFVREHSYVPKLALIQIAVGRDCALIDPLTGLDLGPIDALIDDSAVVKVLHAPTQDLEIFHLRTGVIPRAVFDTQIAAALLGFGHQVPYSGLVRRVLDVKVVSGQSYTDWLGRPLSERQEQYALDDVRYLLPLHDALLAALDARGRVAWVEEECERYADVSLYVTPLEHVYRRLKKGGHLEASTERALWSLVEWRERVARDLDRPRRTAMRDEVLVDLARAAPRSLEALGRFRGLNDRVVRRHGDEILDAVQRGVARNASGPPSRNDGASMPPGGRAALEVLQAVLAARCAAVDLTPTSVATTARLESLVAQWFEGTLTEDHPLLAGWRGDVIGCELVEFLAGAVALHLDPKTLAPVLSPVPARRRSR